MRALGIIPARGGSKQLPGKNLMRLGGKTLIEWAMLSADRAESLMGVIVTTDSPAIVAEASKYLRYCDDIVLRPPELATDECGMVPVLQHALRWDEIHGDQRNPDLIVCLQPTSPFRTGEDIDATVALVTGDVDSAQTITEAPYHPHRLMTYIGEKLVPRDSHNAHLDTRRQDHQWYQPTGGVYVMRRDILMDHGLVFGWRLRGHITPFERSININTPWDFRVAEMIYRYHNPCRMCVTAAQGGGGCTCPPVWP